MMTYLGVWNSGLIRGGLAVATTVLALVTFVPAAWFVARLLETPGPPRRVRGTRMRRLANGRGA
jgi:peptidoglycan/LPS O-acetylase OafA/YrhL